MGPSRQNPITPASRTYIAQRQSFVKNQKVIYSLERISLIELRISKEILKYGQVCLHCDNLLSNELTQRLLEKVISFFHMDSCSAVLTVALRKCSEL